MKQLILLLINLLIFILLPHKLISQQSGNKPEYIQIRRDHKCFASDHDFHTQVLAPEALKTLKSMNGAPHAKFEVVYHNFPENAKAAFQYAVDIWASLLYSPMTIKIDAYWEAMETAKLGNADPYRYYKNFGGAPEPNLYYPIALAEKLAHDELNATDEPEIVARFNSTKSDWYFGTDGKTPNGTYDFATVVLHELGHGLGFDGMLVAEENIGVWFSDFPYIFDMYLENGTGQSLINKQLFPNPSFKLYQQYTGNNLFFNSSIAALSNGGNKPKLYADENYLEGSNIYHLDEATYPAGNKDELMTPSFGRSQSVHNPGQLVLDMFAQMGWINTYITHLQIKDIESTTGTIPVKAVIKSDTNLVAGSFKLHYSFDNFVTPQVVNLTATGNLNEYSALISGTQTGQTISYYLAVTDGFSRIYTAPNKAPTNKYTFKIGTDITIPVIEHSSVVSVRVSDTKVAINATITDNLGIFSAYVEYSINDVAQPNISLARTGDNIYSGDLLFTGGLQKTDVIKYRIVATDGAVIANTAYYPASGQNQFSVANILDAYENDFNVSSDDFALINFSVTTPTGFTNPALHTTHPYNDSPPTKSNPCIAQLKYPIKIRAKDQLMKFDEIVLVEPGKDGAPFGSEDFYDYVAVEGSSDGGNNWFLLDSGYDARRSNAWKQLYLSAIKDGDSQGVGKQENYESHLLNLKGLNDVFKVGDEIIIRFRLYPDLNDHGWGWTIDNILIQGKLAGIEDVDNNWVLQVYPNPVADNVWIYTTATITDATLTITDFLGKQVLLRNYKAYPNNSAEYFDVSHLPEGMYFVRLISGNHSFTKKLIVSR